MEVGEREAQEGKEEPKEVIRGTSLSTAGIVRGITHPSTFPTLNLGGSLSRRSSCTKAQGRARDALERDSLHQLLCSFAAHGDDYIAQRFGSESRLAIGEIILSVLSSVYLPFSKSRYTKSCNGRQYPPPISVETPWLPCLSCQGTASGELAEF